MFNSFNTENFIGKNRKDYFEGWYFRHDGEYPFAFIVGVSKSGTNPHSFIQYIDLEQSYYFTYPLLAFNFDKTDMTVYIDGNIFSKKTISVDIDKDGTALTADISYSKMNEFKKTLLSPSAMGFFTYIPMICNHSVVSMHHVYDGMLSINGNPKKISGFGYIEKDYGNKFPENYVWLHANNSDTSIMCAVAWPLTFNMRGFICIINHFGKQYNMSLYTGAKLEEFDCDIEHANITISNKKSVLKLCIDNTVTAQDLIAPDSNGNMTIKIKENLSADIKINCCLDGIPIELSDIRQCAFECVKGK